MKELHYISGGGSEIDTEMILISRSDLEHQMNFFRQELTPLLEK